jgi:hypothetical protein
MASSSRIKIEKLNGQKFELWNLNMEEFGMQSLSPVDEATPTTTRIVEVEECRRVSKVSI